MNIAIVGATGKAGSRIVKEALARGHRVTAIARHVEKVPGEPNLTAKAGDAADLDALATILSGHDAVISSLRFLDSDPKKLIAAVKKAGVKRYLIVGGAGSLEVEPGKALVDTAEIPAHARAEAAEGREFLNMLRSEREIDWTFLSPSMLFVPGERTGKFRLGKDRLLRDAQGKSWISMEDFAVAMIDELERPEHSRQRFTVGH